MIVDPTKMTPAEINVYLVTEIEQIKNYMKYQPNKCDKKFTTEGKVYSIVLKSIALSLTSITVIGGLIFSLIKMIPIVIALM